MSQTEKINVTHLKRKAILYIRQSTMRQVVVNTESTMRQYGLSSRLQALGWNEAMIEVIDCDLGRSGADSIGRDGFRQMLADVGEGNVGAIACIECSRLSRSSGDWVRLMEICALSGTILIDDDGIYNPNDFNDRLLLGLKGTMSEAELHFLRERMRGGALHKAKRGELRCLLPVGYLYNEAGQVVKDPDIQIQSAVTLFFESFRICGSTHSLAVYYSKKGFLFPTNKNRGFGSPDIYWDVLTPTRAGKILHSPTYAGVYSYGKIQSKNTARGRKLRRASEENWVSNIENHHESYITIEEYRTNIATLASNRTNKGESPPREGSALIQGIAVCARCGHKMSVAYDRDNSSRYLCRHRPQGAPFLNKLCLSVNGRSADEAVAGVILKRLTPEAIKEAEQVLSELNKRKQSEDNYFILQVEKAKYEVEIARKRYMNADPENRLVSAELERLWNERLNQLNQAEVQLGKYRAASDSGNTKTDMERLLALPEKLQKAWNDNALAIKDKKRILRCFVEDITLNMRDDEIHVGIRFKGGRQEFLTVPRPLPQPEKIKTDREIVEYIREASKKYNAWDIAEHLNNAGKRSSLGLPFTKLIVRGIQNHHKIPPLVKHLRNIGYLCAKEKAAQLGIAESTLAMHRLNGKFTGAYIKASKNGDYMYEP